MTRESAIFSDYPIAVYSPQADPRYRGNPFIEALPPICDVEEAVAHMSRLVEVDDGQRAGSTAERMHMLSEIERFVQPLGHHIDLFQRVSMVIRGGYVDRNPVHSDFLRKLKLGVDEINAEAAADADPLPRAPGARRDRLGGGSGLTLLGPSGVGKTTAVEAILRTYEQVIHHPQLEGAIDSLHQIVWLKLSCPPDGSIKGLCMDFFAAVDEIVGTNYLDIYVVRNATVDMLRVNMARIAFLHGLGLLVIDEVQNLSTARSGGAEKMMNFFKLLRDVMRVPLLTIGTPEAERILSGDLQVARRNTGLPQMGRMKNDAEFAFFCESLFYAQYLRDPVEAMPFVPMLFERSQGIADVVVKMFMLAQHRALSIGTERVTVALLSSVYESSFTMLHGYLNDMRAGKEVGGSGYDSAIRDTANLVIAVPPMPPLDGPAAAATMANGGRATTTGVRKRIKSKGKSVRTGCVLLDIVTEGGAA